MEREINDNICIACRFEKLLYRSPDGEYIIADFDDGNALFTAVGKNIPTVRNLRCSVYGKWEEKKNRQQFRVEYYDIAPQTDRAGVTAFLTSQPELKTGSIEADMIYDHFLEQTWPVITQDPGRIEEIAGLNPVYKSRFARTMKTLMADRNIRSLCNKANITIGNAQLRRYLTLYRQDPFKMLTEEPYSFMNAGVSFEKADTLALSLGFASDCPSRITASVNAAMKRVTAGGDTCTRKETLAKAMRKICGDDTDCEEGIAEAIRSGKLIEEWGMLYLPETHATEQAVADGLIRLMDGCTDTVEGIDALIKEYEDLSFDLSEGQKDAVKMVFDNPVSIITGGPGTGKTTVIKAILYIYESVFGNDKAPVLLAPTGKAARRMTEATGRAAGTIHSTVGYGLPDSDRRTIDAKLIIVDEASMMDQQITSQLLACINDGTRLVIVGDPDQLPSVGEGDVLRDMLSSGIIPYTKLDTIYRQAADNPIIANAHAINTGDFGALRFSDEFRLVECEESDLFNRAIELYCKCCKTDGIDNVMLLDPQRNKTAVGTDRFNSALQEILNPPSNSRAEVSSGNRIFRKGDRVMQLRNTDTSKNGETGTITAILTKEVTVDFGSYKEKYKQIGLRDLDLAYCSTVHKAQGMEYDTVIIIITESHSATNRRDLLYTAVTRSKNRVYILGQKETLRKTVSEAGTKRHTGLMQSLIERRNSL